MKGHEITYQHVTMDMAKAVISDAVHQHSKMPEMIRSYFRALHQLQLLFAICGVEASAAAGFQRLLTSTYPKRQFMFGLSLGFQGQGGGEGNPIIKITRFRLHTLLHSSMFFPGNLILLCFLALLVNNMCVCVRACVRACRHASLYLHHFVDFPHWRITCDQSLFQPFCGVRCEDKVVAKLD